MSTRSIAPYTLIEPLRLANGRSIMGSKQQQLLDIIRAARIDDTPQCVSVYHFKDAGEASQLLADEGFDIMAEPIPEGVAGDILVTIMKLALEWYAKRSDINCDGKWYRSVELDGELCHIPIHPYPVVRLYNKSRYKVYATRMPGSFIRDLDILHTVNAFTRLCENSGVLPVEVSLPAAYIDHQPDISWIEGMSWDGGAVHKAYKQVKLDINEDGTAVEAATAITVTGFCLPDESKKIVIDGPYLFWIVGPNLSQPLYAGHIMEDAFREL